MSPDTILMADKTTAELCVIAAVARNGAFGFAGKMPWHFPADLQRFKALTINQTVVMGRKTWQSLPRAPLPNRRNLILSRQKNFNATGAEVVANLHAAVKFCQTARLFVIGGAGIIEDALPQAKRFFLTQIHQDVPADVFLHWRQDNWKEISRQKMGTDFDFVEYEQEK